MRRRHENIDCSHPTGAGRHACLQPTPCGMDRRHGPFHPMGTSIGDHYRTGVLPTRQAHFHHDGKRPTYIGNGDVSRYEIQHRREITLE